YRAGAEFSELEFVQFHPTALYLKKAPRFLLSEALRGEGAYLRNMEMMRFMAKYHPMGELAPRDVVARAIMHELERVKAKEPVVYLDMTHLEESHIRKRFPRIYATCMQYNIDITSEFVPIRPAAHYAMGGVRTDLEGRATLPGLYAAGEAAGTGVHGANRLASNSLLEGLVFGARAAAAMVEDARPAPAASEAPAPSAAVAAEPAARTAEMVDTLRRRAWESLGLERDGAGLRGLVADLAGMGAAVAGRPQGRAAAEARNLVAVAAAMATCALFREESRGAHFRTDFPRLDDHRFRGHTRLS